MDKSPYRRAQAGNSITWIFVLIAGGSFLLIFYQVANYQITTAGNVQIDQRIDAFTAIVETLQSSPDTNQTLAAPNTDLTVGCDQTGTITISPTTTDGAYELTDQPLYAPTTLPQKPIEAVTADYQAPFTIATILYLLPEGTTIPRLDNGALPQQLQPYTSGNTNPGNIPPAMRAGQLLTDNEAIKQCVNNTLSEQARLSYETIRYKANSLIDTTPDRCNDSYTNANTTLTALRDMMTEQNFHADTFHDNVSALQQQNDGLIADSCPHLY